MTSPIIELRDPKTITYRSAALRLAAVRAIAAAHATGSETNVYLMRQALGRIVQLCDGEPITIPGLKPPGISIERP